MPLLDMISLENILLKDRLKVILQELAPFGLFTCHDDLGKSAVPHIVIEGSHDIAANCGAEGSRGEGDVKLVRNAAPPTSHL